MHQNQWLAVVEELGGNTVQAPIPNSFAQSEEDNQNNYNFYATSLDGTFPEGRWTSGTSVDGKGEFTVFRNEPLGDVPNLGPARPDSGAQTDQIGKL
jgi:Mn-containing catalase